MIYLFCFWEDLLLYEVIDIQIAYKFDLSFEIGKLHKYKSTTSYNIM